MISCIFEDGGKASLRHVVIDAVIINDNKILLVKRSEKLVQGGKWALIGGFVERDEILQEALNREVLEETGYKLKEINLFTIIDNPNRKGEERQNIAFVFVCQAGEKVSKPDWESTEQKWFDINDLPKEEEIAFDHFETIQMYLKYKNDYSKVPSFKSE
jgi:ADP-ribose pyrophosphatase YjhB (NUDIX family)